MTLKRDLLQMPGCKDDVGLFVDPDFPADAKSLFKDEAAPPVGHPPKEVERGEGSAGEQRARGERREGAGGRREARGGGKSTQFLT